MKKKFNEILVGVSILTAILLSMRVVMIPTPLNVGEQVGILSLMLDYTLRRAKSLEDKDEV
jgi:hypothetical protein